MDVSGTFTPLAVDLIDNVFGVPIVYLQQNGIGYDPATGTVTDTPTTYNIKGAILQMTRNEEGGAAETRELKLWIHHGPGGLPALPVTGDRIQLYNTAWKVQSIQPTYAGATLIASSLVCADPA